MKKKSSWLSKILPSPSENIEHGTDLDKGYKYFSRGLSMLLTVLVLVPSTIISLLSHYQYKQLLEKDELIQMMLNMEQAQTTIERFVSKLQSIIKFVARDDRYLDLINPTNLEALFVRLQNEHPDFADIEIIDSEGMQKSYVGPYQLKTQDYSDQTWYQEVLLRGVYISNVFSGFRQVPHFVIAISRKHPQQEGSWVLRVTIDGKTLQRFVDTISTTSVNDVFLVDAKRFQANPFLLSYDFGHLYDGRDGVTNFHRCQKIGFLAHIDGPGARQQRADDGRYKAGRQHAVRDAGLKKSIFGVIFIDMRRVEITGDPGK